ncbi:MAG TPA: M36 family metallopeptidase, partial [Bryobacteraceae bacterium]|nr:M36 family metallopeptidase [Bryobacteraceae bacterium]
MKLSCLLLPFFAALVVAAPDSASAAGAERLPDFDRRGTPPGKAVEWAPGQKAALDELKRRVPEIEAEIDPTVGSPKWLRARSGFLTGPNGEGRTVSPKAAQAFAPGDTDRPIKAVLHEHRELFGHGPEVLLSARRARDYVTAHNQLRTLVWEQQLEGIPVYEATLLAYVTARGELASLSSQFLPDPEQAAKLGTPERVVGRQPSLPARDALRKAVDEVGEEVAAAAIAEIGGPAEAASHEQRFRAGALPGEARAHLVWLPLDRERLRLCWAVELTRRERGERFRVLVDSENGQVLLRRCLTFDLSEATYRVFTSDSPSPFSPGLSVPSRFQPPLVSRSLVTLSALDTNASPLGWIRDGENETSGNNVDAHLDRDGDNLPDLPRPRGSPFRVFDSPLDLGQSPTNNGAAAVVQLFYWCNWMHDKLYELGFTEAAGNFQKDTFGRGGLGNSALQADAQDGSGFNNANFTPSPEGQSPRIQMFLFNGPDPWRDADLDAEVILH